MKFFYPAINTVFDTDIEYVNTIIIENQKLLLDLLLDLENQIQGKEGKIVVSDDNKEMAISKSVELLLDPIRLELNQRSILTKLAGAMEKSASEGHYERLMEELGQLEAFLLDLASEQSGNIGFKKIDLSTVLKACGLEFIDDYNGLGEKLIDYMELQNAYDRPKLFMTVNLRSFLSDKEAELFLDTVIRHGYQLFMIENKEYPLLVLEKRYIIDKDLCEIG